jgi:predicted nucleic acid-binding protein
VYVVDTNIINRLVDGQLASANLPSDGNFIATHIQRDELEKTPDEQRRAQLRAKFKEAIDREVLTEATVIGVSRIGLAKISDGKRYSSLRDALSSRNKAKSNNTQDALIAEVAIEHGWVLLTADRDLAEVAKKHGCKLKYHPA